MFHKKLGWLKENWRTVVVIVVVALVTIFSFGTLTGAAALWGGAVLGALGTTTAAVGAVATMMIGGAVMGAMSGALGAILAGGDFGDVLRGAAIGAISGALTGAMHGVGSGTGFSAANMANVVGHGIIGGLQNVAMGGKFGSGFRAASASAASSFTGLTNPDSSPMNIYGRTAVAGAIGGTASAIGGGKFANGAGTGDFAHLVNAEGGNLLQHAQNEAFKTTASRVLVHLKELTEEDGVEHGALVGVSKGKYIVSNEVKGDSVSVDYSKAKFLDQDSREIDDVNIIAKLHSHPNNIMTSVATQGGAVIFKTFFFICWKCLQ